MQNQRPDNLPPLRERPQPFIGGRPTVFSRNTANNATPAASPAQITATAPAPAQPPAVVKPKIRKPRRDLKKEILSRLDKGMVPGKIIEELQCQAQAVYYHVNKRRGRTSPASSPVKTKLNRFNRKFFKNSGYSLSLDDLKAATGGFVCAFSGKKIDLDKDVFFLTMKDGVPTIYLSVYHRLLPLLQSNEYQDNCISFLRSKGFTVKKQTESKEVF